MPSHVCAPKLPPLAFLSCFRSAFALLSHFAVQAPASLVPKGVVDTLEGLRSQRLGLET